MAASYGRFAGAVSYTHLDVYKRQVTRYGINNLPHDHDAQLQKAIELLGGTPVLATATPDEAEAE